MRSNANIYDKMIMTNYNINDFEIMAPVGSRESLAAAIQAGADSIYFGIEKLNMRAHSASTFTIDDLREIAATCNEHGIKTYLTVNTIIYNEDIPLMHEIVDAAKEAGISACYNQLKQLDSTAICLSECVSLLPDSSYRH